MIKVFISGASKGIGKAIAENFNEAKYEVVICSRSETSIKQFSSQCNKTNFKSLKIDLGTKEGRHVLVEEFENSGYPDIVIANMNASRAYSKMENYSTAEDFFSGIENHISYLVDILPGCLDKQRVAGYGRWVAISSIVSAMNGVKGMGYYLMQKRMLESFFDTLALEVAHPGITSNSLLLGIIETERIKTKANYKKLSRSNLLHRAGTVEEVAKLVKFLVQKEAGYITGEKIKIDGGISKSWYI